MTQTYLIKNAEIINESQNFKGSILIENEKIKKIFKENDIIDHPNNCTIVDASGLTLMPGMIDDQVHFREPGLTHKADIGSESRAAVAGGITSFMEMPNTSPRTLDEKTLKNKLDIGAKTSLANYGFYLGTHNESAENLKNVDPGLFCGIKIFLGSSTGNMLVDDPDTLKDILKFSAENNIVTAVHSEDETIIRNNLAQYKSKFGDEIPVSAHPQIRNHEACLECSTRIIKLAKETKAQLHILHLSTKEELELFSNQDLDNKHITAEACVHHLWFCDEDYERLGNHIKWNPAIKGAEDRAALREAVKSNLIDIIATDHAPHTLEEKANSNYLLAPAGGPLVQHALPTLLELYHQGIFSLETICQKVCHNPAIRFKVEKRGYIREGYFADLVLFDLKKPWTCTQDNILYKCGWSPFKDYKFKSSITHTFINGNLVYENGTLDEKYRGQALSYSRY